LVVVSEAWFLNLKSGKSDTAEKVMSPPNSRKVILVAKKVYVPMYASDDTTSAVADRLLPISPALTSSDGTVMTEGRQQPMAVDYSSSMYLQPPPVASYAMYAPASANVAAAYAAPVQFPAVVADQGVGPQQYAVYPVGYGAAGPQFYQYAAAPQMSDGVKFAEIHLSSHNIFILFRFGIDLGDAVRRSWRCCCCWCAFPANRKRQRDGCRWICSSGSN
jgi:hypothetical protein